MQVSVSVLMHCFYLFTVVWLLTSNTFHTQEQAFHCLPAGDHVSGLLLQAEKPAIVSAEKARTPLGNLTNVLDSQIIGYLTAVLEVQCSSILQAVNQWRLN